MKIGERKLKMSDGSIRTFKSERARDNFERVARAKKHGWNPDGKLAGVMRRYRNA